MLASLGVSNTPHCPLFLLMLLPIFIYNALLLLLFPFKLVPLPRVPFAQPPLGKLRLKDPAPKKGWIEKDMVLKKTSMMVGLLFW